MPSVKMQRYKANQFRKTYAVKQRNEGLRAFNPPPSLLSKEEILEICLRETTSSFGLVGCDTKIEEALKTVWFSFDQDDLLFCIKTLLYLERQKLNEINKQTLCISGKEIPIPNL